MLARATKRTSSFICLSIFVEKGRPLQFILYNTATAFKLNVVNFAYQNPPTEISNTLTPLRQFVDSNCFRLSFDYSLHSVNPSRYSPSCRNEVPLVIQRTTWERFRAFYSLPLTLVAEPTEGSNHHRLRQDV